MTSSSRLLSVDFLRGITVAAMILANNPGSWDYVYAPLQHAAWNGCTPTDLIFPIFLFIVGISINLSFYKLLESEISKKDIYLKIVKRTIILFSLGLIINLFPFTSDQFHNFRIPGVLQRISLVFFFASMIYVNTSPRAQLVIIASILVSYWAIMTLIPIPGIGEAGLAKGNNISAYVDHLILNNHVWIHSRTWDPEGILSTLPAIATGLIGVVTANVFKEKEISIGQVYKLIALGVLLLGVGLVWSMKFPINKSLWTSSYVCFTSGCALILLAISFYVLDILSFKSLSKPFLILGCNAITIYVLSELIAKLFYIITVEQKFENVPLKSLIFSIFNVSFVGPYNASLLLGVLWVLVFWGIGYVMYRKKIFIKV